MMASMPSAAESPPPAANLFTEMLRIQGEAARKMVAAVLPEVVEALPTGAEMSDWGEAALRLQRMWLEFHEQQGPKLLESEMPVPLFADPAQWLGMMQGWYSQMPWLDPERQAKLVEEGMALWDDVLAQYALGPKPDPDGPEVHLPRQDRRFADPAWREQPVFALIHQTYLLLAERILEAVDAVEGLDEREREQLRFATRSVLEAMSPSNFPLTNPVVLERTLETHGENLARGMERLARDLEKGRLTPTRACSSWARTSPAHRARWFTKHRCSS